MPGEPDPLYEKAREVLLDALDILRLLRGVAAASLVGGLGALLADARSAVVTTEALGHLRALFGHPDAPGSGFAARAAEALEPADTIRASCAALAMDLLSLLPG